MADAKVGIPDSIQPPEHDKEPGKHLCEHAGGIGGSVGCIHPQQLAEALGGEDLNILQTPGPATCHRVISSNHKKPLLVNKKHLVLVFQDVILLYS